MNEARNTRLKHAIADALELAARDAELFAHDPNLTLDERWEWHRKFLMWTNESDKLRSH